MKLDFGTPKNPNFESIRVASYATLKNYLGLGIYPRYLTDFVVDRTKAYLAKSIATIALADESIAHMALIAFGLGDATGSKLLPNQKDPLVPEEFFFKYKTWRVFPRDKSNTIAEFIFPLGSFFQNKHYKFNSLYELSLDENNRITREAVFGVEPEKYDLAMISHPEMNSLRFGETLVPAEVDPNSNTRFGDPHAIYAPRNISQAIQVAGFLSITESNLNSDGKNFRNFSSLKHINYRF